MNRELGELAAIVIGNDLHARRQKIVFFDELELLLNSREHGIGLPAVAHQHDPLHDVVLVVVADHPEARRVAYRDVRDVADADGRAGIEAVDLGSLGDDDVVDVRHRRAEVAEEADPADVVGLLADGQALTAHVLVGVLKRVDGLGERDAVAAQPIGVDVDVVLLGGSSVAGDVDDALNLAPLALHDPVFGRLEVGERVALALERVSEDFADGVPRRDLGRQAVG